MNTDDMLPDEDEPRHRLEENKRIGRILVLVTLIQNEPRRWTRRRLAEHLEYSERQIDKDLQLIRHRLRYGLAHSREGYYFTRAPELRAIRYTPAEALALLGALTLATGTGVLDATSLAAALARTEEALPGAFVEAARALRRSARPPTPHQRQRAAILQRVQLAHTERRCLAVTYESAARGGAATERILRPYDLSLYEGAWLLIAHDSLRDEVRYFRLDRIVRATLTEERYTIPGDFDLEIYRGTGWGILRDMAGAPVDVVLQFDAAEGRRVRDDPRPDQRAEKQPDGTWLVTFRTGITSELVRWIFRWGTGCTVVAPPELRTAVAEVAAHIAQRHDSRAPPP